MVPVMVSEVAAVVTVFDDTPLEVERNKRSNSVF